MRKILMMALILTFLLPAYAQDTLQLSFLTQYTSVSQMAFSPDGQLLVTVSFEYQDDTVFQSSIQLWDVNTGQPKASLQPDSPAVSAVFNQDGTQLFTGHENGYVSKWNLSDLQMTDFAPAHLYAPQLITGSNGALVSYDSSGSILWDAAGFSPQLILVPDANENALSVQTMICPDNACLASFYTSGEIRFFNAADGSLIQTLTTGHQAEPYTAAFSPDSAVLATGYETLELWQVASGQQVGLINSGADIFYAAFSPDGTQIATLDAAGRLIIWDATTYQAVQTLAEGIAEGWDIGFSPNGTTLAVARDEGEIELYTLK